MPLTPTQTHQLLKQLNHCPRHALGQNFLIDPNIVEKQLKLAAVNAQDTLVEIGPGLGTLTEALLKIQATVYAIELDKKLHQHLENTLAIDYKNTFNLMQGDAIDAPLGLLPATVSSFKIVANLPYAISTPWFAKILQSPNLPQTIVVMLQKEGAERLTAQPGTKKISPISLCLQAAFDVEGTYKVARNAFYPTPDVDSVLLSLNRKTIPYRFHPTIIALMQKFFTQRRKQLAHLIKQDTLHATLLKKWTDHLSTLHIPLTHRPEMLTLTEWIALNNLFQTHTHSPTP